MSVPNSKERQRELRLLFPFLPIRERNRLVKEILLAVKEADEQERQKSKPEAIAKQIRKVLPRYRHTQAAIRKAKEYVQKAISVWSPNGAALGFLEEVQRELESAESRLKHSEGLLAAGIYTPLRRPHESQRIRFRPLFQDHGYRLPHLRSRVVEHWLITTLDSQLTPHIPVAAARYRTISDIFAVSRGESGWSTDRIKSVIRRSKRPSTLPKQI